MNEYKELKPKVIRAVNKDLEAFTREELREYAKTLDLPIGGNKKDVVLHLLHSGKATICATLGDCLNPLFIRSQFQMAAFFQPINTDT